MTDPELDSINERVAKALGWKEWIAKPHQQTHGHRMMDGRCIDGCDRDISPMLPDFSRSISAAWEIVETVNMQGEKYFTLFKNGIHYSAEWAGDKSYGIFARAEADTAPLAICLAFLKMKEHDNAAR